MVTISVNLNPNGMSRERMAAVLPLVNSVYEDRPGDTGRHVRARREFDPALATKEALHIIKAVPEAVVELRKGTPASLTELAHGVAPRQLGTAMRLMRFADDYGIRLVPDRAAVSEGTVMLNGKAATEVQLKGLNMDWKLAFDFSGCQAYALLERAEPDSLGQLAVTRVQDYKDKGFTEAMIEEVRHVLAEHDLGLGMDVRGWPLRH